MQHPDISIDKEGKWFYGDKPMDRIELLRLFYRFMQYRTDGYYVVTPVEEVRVLVEDAPYSVESISSSSNGNITILLNEGSEIPLDADHPLRMGADDVLYIRVREHFEARFSRRAFIELGLQMESEDGIHFRIRSFGTDFFIQASAGL